MYFHKKLIVMLLCLLLFISSLAECSCNQPQSTMEEEQPTVSLQQSPEPEEVVTPGMYSFTEEDISQDESTGIHYINNILLVFFDVDATQEQKQAVIDAVDGEVAGELEMIGQLQIRVKQSSLAQLEELCTQVESMDGVLAASYDMASQYEDGYIPNDPYDSGLFSKDEVNWETVDSSASNWWAMAIDAPGAWEYKDELSPVRVGIVDSGFDQNHEDYSIQILNPTVVNEEDHGSHVAGIIGATMDNEEGIAGVAPNATLTGFDWEPDQLQNKVGGWDTNSAILAGLTLCVQDGCKVVNFSIQKTHNLVDDTQQFSQSVIDAEGRLASSYIASLLLRGYDFVVVQSAGNGAQNGIGVNFRNNGFFSSVTQDNCETFDGKVPEEQVLGRIINVGAADVPDANGVYMLTDFSNGGEGVDIAAPGKNIYSSVNNGYDYKDGTSMAAPMVAGAAAVVWGINEELEGIEVKEILCENTNHDVIRNPRTKIVGTQPYPLLNVKLAVEAAIGYGSMEDLVGTTYQSTTTECNPPYIPKVEFMEGNTFNFTENLYEGMGNYTGHFTVQGNQLTLDVEDINFSGFLGDDVKVIRFTIMEDGTLTLQNDLCFSRSGQTFGRVERE